MEFWNSFHFISSGHYLYTCTKYTSCILWLSGESSYSCSKQINLGAHWICVSNLLGIMYDIGCIIKVWAWLQGESICRDSLHICIWMDICLIFLITAAEDLSALSFSYMSLQIRITTKRYSIIKQLKLRVNPLESMIMFNNKDFSVLSIILQGLNNIIYKALSASLQHVLHVYVFKWITQVLYSELIYANTVTWMHI